LNVLIVESQASLANLWKSHLTRMGAEVMVAIDQTTAIELIESHAFDVIVLDLVLENGGALTVSDMARYRQPAARVVFVTSANFFSDGSIFRHCPNACAFLPSSTEPSDLAVLVDHYGRPH
jgi:DNA-binding NtrC family response regulator